MSNKFKDVDDNDIKNLTNDEKIEIFKKEVDSINKKDTWLTEVGQYCLMEKEIVTDFYIFIQNKTL